MRTAAIAIYLAFLAVALVSTQADREPASAELLARIGQYVTGAYGRARTIVSRETVRLQPLDAALQPEANWRLLVYELRIEWVPGSNGRVDPVLARRSVKT